MYVYTLHHHFYNNTIIYKHTIFTSLPLSPLVDSVHDRSQEDDEEEEEERETGVESFQLE